MDKNTKLILAATASPARWEDDDKSSNELTQLQNEYRERLYSPKGRELLKSNPDTEDADG